MLLQNNPKHHPSTTVLASCYEYELFVLIHCVWFLPNIVLYFKYLYIGPVCPKESSGSFKFSDTEFGMKLVGCPLLWRLWHCVKIQGWLRPANCQNFLFHIGAQTCWWPLTQAHDYQHLAATYLLNSYRSNRVVLSFLQNGTKCCQIFPFPSLYTYACEELCFFKPVFIVIIVFISQYGHIISRIAYKPDTRRRKWK